MIGARGQVLAAYATANGQQVKVLHRWPASAQPGPLVGDPAGGYALLSIASAPGRKKLTPHVKGDHCLVVSVNNNLMCENATQSKARFVSVNLATGRVTTLPFTETGPVGWGMVAW